LLDFEYIEFLYGLLAIPLMVLVFLLTRSWRKRARRRFGEMELVNQLLPGHSNSKKNTRFILLMAAFVFAIFGLANLRLGTKKESVVRESSDIIIAFDVSKSMLAEDTRPNRLERAKFFTSNFLQKINNDKVGLIVFAGNAYLQMPLTVDPRAAMMYLSLLNTSLVPSQGTAISDAISLALESFDNEEEKKKSQNSKALIIITDGENHEEGALEMAQTAADKGVIIYTIGVGTAKGAPIPVYSGDYQSDYKKDNEGNIILTKLNETMLQQLAATGGGSYFNLTEGGKIVDNIKKELAKLEKSEGESYDYPADRKHFQIFLGVALFLLTLEFFVSDRRSEWLARRNLFGETKKHTI
jgi:Ca-activated chloride channel family protein